MNSPFVLAPQPTMKRVADLGGPDFYPTPAWATFALIENEKFTGDIWESACGDGAMSEVLKNASSRVESSDLYDREYGEASSRYFRRMRPLGYGSLASASLFIRAGLFKKAVEQLLTHGLSGTKTTQVPPNLSGYPPVTKPSSQASVSDVMPPKAGNCESLRRFFVSDEPSRNQSGPLVPV